MNTEIKQAVKTSININDICADIRTHEELFANGYIRRSAKDTWNWDAVQNYYFSKLPTELIVDEKIEVGQKLLWAKDVYNGKRNNVLSFVKLIIPSNSSRDLKPIIIAKDTDEIDQIGFMDCFCKMPQKFIRKHVSNTSSATGAEPKKRGRKAIGESPSIIQFPMDKEFTIKEIAEKYPTIQYTSISIYLKNTFGNKLIVVGQKESLGKGRKQNIYKINS